MDLNEVGGKFDELENRIVGLEQNVANLKIKIKEIGRKVKKKWV